MGRIFCYLSIAKLKGSKFRLFRKRKQYPFRATPTIRDPQLKNKPIVLSANEKYPSEENLRWSNTLNS